MPEGPEVTVIREGLDDLLKGVTVDDILITKTSKYREKAPNNFQKIKERLPLKLLNIESKGKLIYWNFDGYLYMINCLGMSGFWTSRDQKHSSIEIVYRKNGEEKKYLFCRPKTLWKHLFLYLLNPS